MRLGRTARSGGSDQVPRNRDRKARGQCAMSLDARVQCGARLSRRRSDRDGTLRASARGRRIVQRIGRCARHVRAPRFFHGRKTIGVYGGLFARKMFSTRERRRSVRIERAMQRRFFRRASMPRGQMREGRGQSRRTLRRVRSSARLSGERSLRSSSKARGRSVQK